jgi:hypothetical protein
VGLELVGVKIDKSCLVVLDHYPERKRLLMVELIQNAPESKEIPPPDQVDQKLVQLINDKASPKENFAGLGVHAPLTLPPLFEQGLGTKKIPWMQQNKNPEVRWMKEVWDSLSPQPKAFSPYLQRPTEIWLRFMTKDHFNVSEGFGANTAPLLARMLFLQPYLPIPINEVFPKASVARIVSSLGMPKWIGAMYSDLEKGIEAREEFLKFFSKKCPQIFIYQRDFDTLIQNLNAFNAWICALTQHLCANSCFEKPPEGYPKNAHFIRIPPRNIDWESVF